MRARGRWGPPAYSCLCGRARERERERECASGWFTSVLGSGLKSLIPSDRIEQKCHTVTETHSARLRAGGSDCSCFGCVEEEEWLQRLYASVGASADLTTPGHFLTGIGPRPRATRSSLSLHGLFCMSHGCSEPQHIVDSPASDHIQTAANCTVPRPCPFRSLAFACSTGLSRSEGAEAR